MLVDVSPRAILALSVLVVLLSVLAAGAQALPRAGTPADAPGDKWIGSDGALPLAKVLAT